MFAPVFALTIAYFVGYPTFPVFWRKFHWILRKLVGKSNCIVSIFPHPIFPILNYWIRSCTRRFVCKPVEIRNSCFVNLIVNIFPHPIFPIGNWSCLRLCFLLVGEGCLLSRPNFCANFGKMPNKFPGFRKIADKVCQRLLFGASNKYMAVAHLYP